MTPADGAVATVPPVVLDRRTARELSRAATKSRAATAERDALIVAAAEAGASLREIADAVGLSFSGVKKIIDRHRR